MAEEEKKQSFELRKIYVKDMSFESPMAPNIFRTESATPSIEVQLNVRSESLGDDMYESVVIVTVNGKLGEKHAFLVEVQQAGVFEIAGIEPDQGLEAALEVACPNLLFPFAREAVHDLVSRGGFPQLLVAPVNFESLYRRKRQRKAEQAGGDGQQAGGDGQQAGGDGQQAGDADSKSS